MKGSQLLLHPNLKPRAEHGGDLRRGKRKLARPIDPRRSMHVVLRSSRARGALSLLHPRHAKTVTATLYRAAYRNSVQLEQVGNSGNHVHLLLKGRTRRGIQDFLREAAGRIAQLVTGARKGHATGRFWDALAFSRVVAPGRRPHATARRYVLQNAVEGITGWKRGRYVVLGSNPPQPRAP
jgi:REP element-mobilizing transposase RayT